ncbi:YceI family protein [Rivibacter subsaxonicus]|nr:YceI family protein [Rivibacter subsaxonicus]
MTRVLPGRPWYAATLALLLAAPVVAAAEPVDYVLDPERSWVQFELLHFGTSTIRGRLGPARGVVSLDPAAGRGEISIELDTRTLSTGLPIFDARIRRPDLLATEEYPVAWFVSRNLQLDPRGGVRSATGELTLRGASLPLRLEAERFGCRPDPASGRERCGGDFVGRLRRSEAGMSFGQPFVGDEVTLRIQVEALRQP